MSLLRTLKARAKQLKSESVALFYAHRDRRTPWTAKLLIAFTLAYLLSPVDFIPDFIPILGYLDDLLIVPLLIALSIRLIPAEVMAAARNKATANGGMDKRTNWVFGAVVVALWLLVGYQLYRWARPRT